MAGKDKDQDRGRDKDHLGDQAAGQDGDRTTAESTATAPIAGLGTDREATPDAPRNGTGGERAAASEFESGLDYGAFVEDDEPEEVAPDARDAPQGTGPRPDPDLQRTQSIDRSELEALAAGDGQAADREAATFPQDLPAARARGERPGVVTATATPDPESMASPDPTPTTVWSAGPALAPSAAGTATAAGAASAAAGGPHGVPGPVAADDDGRRPDVRGAEARAAARDEALEGSSTAPRVMQVLLAIFFPIVVLIAAVRAVASPLFLWVEYHRPGFPADPFGFTTEDRLTYGSAGMDYLFNLAPARYLGDLQHQGRTLFTDSEVSHMADVKLVMLVAMVVGTLLALACVVFMVYLARTAKGGIRRSLFAGSLWMLVVLIALVVMAVFGWQQFFAGFHSLFFADGTWTFRSSDALIRLYPNQFWMDAGLVVGALVLVTLVVTLVCTWPTRRRRHDARLAQVDMVRRRNEWYDATA
jgi:integral membrane protein (TIGR01906 family)